MISTSLFRMKIVVIYGNFPFSADILLHLKNWPRIDLTFHTQLKKTSRFSIISNKLRMLKKEGR